MLEFTVIHTLLLVFFLVFCFFFELVWVDAPDPSFCRGYGNRCCLNGRFSPQYEWRNFASGDMKKLANEKLWNEAQYNRVPFYKGIIKFYHSNKKKFATDYIHFCVVTILSHILSINE